MRRLAVAVVSLALAAGIGTRSGAQETAVRFEIATVTDSTFTFAVGRHDWVAGGDRGIVVDPRRRDALVARFRITRVQNGLATAVVTGQTTSLTTQHAALLTQPPPVFWRQPTFWIGLMIGGIVGWAVGS